MKTHSHISVLHDLYLRENQPFRKVHRMIDLFESIIKSHTAVILSEYVKHKHLSDAAKGMLAQGLRKPSLGTWQMFSRVLFCELQLSAYDWMMEEMQLEFILSDHELYSQLQNGKIVFPTFNKEKLLLLKSEHKKRKSNFDNVINLRNDYAHGATPSDTHCETDLEKFEPFLNQLLELHWLNKSALEVREGKVYIKTEKGAISLHPILVFRKENSEASYAFFNDLKNDKVGLLNYPLSKYYREKDFRNEFHEYLPLDEWKKTGSNEFCQHVEELTETFKGRTQERKTLIGFVREKHKGYLSIQGNPGIGKSALIAQFINDLRASKDSDNVLVVDYFIRRSSASQSKAEHLFNYLNRRTDELFAPGKSIKAEGNGVWDLQQQLFAKWRLWGEQREKHKLLYLIDGLDEGTENEIANYMPAENFNGVLIVYGTRPGGHKSIDNLLAKLSPEYHTKIELTGLSKEDIRALVYEVANKYELERESAWVDMVLERSQGNPLYLKLLCDAIENGSIALNDINALPDQTYDYYKAILDRYAADTMDGDALLAGLFAFAAAKDYLTMAHLGLINKLGDATVQRISSILKEVLYENPLTEEVLDYQLFHESFREYLVKEKAKELRDAAERILDFCASWESLEGTWEQRYTLQQYAIHAFESKKEARSMELLALMGNTAYTDTQKKVLKQFDATRELFRLCLKKASSEKKIYPQLEAALKLVDLKYEEANDAPHVVGLVANGNPNDFDLALNRIDSFGGADKEGVERRFTLYMLCLMELTLLESKTKPFRKAAIEKLVNHLDEQILVDHSILKWNDFFPSYTMFLMACEWSALGLDYRMVYKRTDDWESDWLSEKGPYNDKQFEVLQDCARGISDDYSKTSALRDISTELAKQGMVEESAAALQEALTCARGISDDDSKSSTLRDISIELAKQGMVEEALTCASGISDDNWKRRALQDISTELAKQGMVEEALTCARGISDDYSKSFLLQAISTELAKQGMVEESASALQEALTCARGISDDYSKSSALQDISIELAKQGMVEEALTCARGISDDDWKSSALYAISIELAKQGKVEEALTCARGISDDDWKSSALYAISTKLAKQGMVEEALTCARGISDDFSESFLLQDISIELAKQGKVEEALTFARGISSDRKKSSALYAISIELAKQGMVEEALTCARGISDDYWKRRALQDISTELAKQGMVEESASALQEALTCARGISDDDSKRRALQDISTELAKQGMVEEALTCARGISDDYSKSSVLQDISTELAKQGMVEEALTCARGISDDNCKRRALRDISTELAKQGMVEEALTCARGIRDDYWKSSALQDISTELAKQGMVEEALTCARGISDDYSKRRALQDISTELAKQGMVEESASALQEALTCARGISDDDSKSRALRAISTELAKQGKVEEALTCARGNSDDDSKRRALQDISTELAKQGMVEEALTCARGISDDYWKSSVLQDISIELAKQGMVEEALTCARGISDDYSKSSALQDISTELAKQGMVEESASALQEALTCTRGISDDYWKSSALQDISTELAKQGMVEESASALQEALTCARGISSDREKSSALQAISIVLAKQGMVEEALTCARGISDDNWKRRALRDISIELAKQGMVDEALTFARGISDDGALKDISTELAKQGMVEEALTCARGIRDDYWKSSALQDISTELAKQGMVEESASALQEALTCARGISDDDSKSRALRAISTELAKQGKVEEALTCARGISSDREKSSALQAISIVLAKQGMVEEALTCARGISDDDSKSSALQAISIELAEQGDWALAETIGLQIPWIATRQECWRSIASNTCNNGGWFKALQQVNHLQSDEARIFYLKGWAVYIKAYDADAHCVQVALSHLAHDSESVESLLQKHALREVFFGQADTEKIKQLNRSLNIQWAIDIQAQFHRHKSKERLYTNLDEWLHEIEDEDDKEDILGWAEKVSSGKMTEDKFAKRVRGK